MPRTTDGKESGRLGFKSRTVGCQVMEYYKGAVKNNWGP